jgi:hypothetical protein
MAGAVALAPSSAGDSQSAVSQHACPAQQTREFSHQTCKSQGASPKHMIKMTEFPHHFDQNDGVFRQMPLV